MNSVCVSKPLFLSVENVSHTLHYVFYLIEEQLEDTSGSIIVASREVGPGFLFLKTLIYEYRFILKSSHNQFLIVLRVLEKEWVYLNQVIKSCLFK